MFRGGGLSVFSPWDLSGGFAISRLGAPAQHTALHIVLRYTAVKCIELHWLALHCTALHCTALDCTALHCSALHCTALHSHGSRSLDITMLTLSYREYYRYYRVQWTLVRRWDVLSHCGQDNTRLWSLAITLVILQCPVCSVNCTVFSVKCAMCSVHCEVDCIMWPSRSAFSLQCEVCSLCKAVCSVHYALQVYSLQCAVFLKSIKFAVCSIHCLDVQNVEILGARIPKRRINPNHTSPYLVA